MLEHNESKTGVNIITAAVITLTGLIVLAVTYSVYIFIDLTHVSTAANVHVTKNLFLAGKRAQGKLYSNESKGISDWVVYGDKNIGFELKYPNEFRFQDSADCGHLLIIKKFNKVSGNGSDSLSMAIYLDIRDVPDNQSLRQTLEKAGVAWNESWRQQEFGGRAGIRTGERTDSSGVIKDTVYWQFNGKVFSLEGDFYNMKSAENEKIFDEILSEFEFII